MSKTFSFVDENGELYPEWGEKSLGDCVRYNEKRGTLDEEFFYVDLGSVTSGVVTGKNVIQKDKAPSRAQRILIDGDVLFQNVRPYQKNNVVFRSDNWDKQVVASTGFTQMSPQHGTSSEFIYHTVMTDEFNKRVMEKCTGTGYPAINSSELMKITIPLPSLPEQQKIAEFFSALDERIELTATKVNLLKEQKQGYLQKVFARELVFTDENGDTYPEWEEKKLGEIYLMASGLPFKGEEYQADGEYSVITNANVQGNRYLDMSSASRVVEVPDRIKPHQVLRRGDILISLDGNVGRVSMVKEDKSLLAQRVGVLKAKSDYSLDNDFLYVCLANDRFKEEMLSKQQGGGLKHIYARDVESFQIPIPCLSEQKKIGSLFSSLDEQIELTEGKLALLKEQKKGYLQGIFG